MTVIAVRDIPIRAPAAMFALAALGNPVHAAEAAPQSQGLASAALAISLLCLLVGLAAIWRMAAIIRNQNAMIRSVEAALSAHALRAEKDRATLSELAETARREMGVMSSRMAARMQDSAATRIAPTFATAAGGKVIALGVDQSGEPSGLQAGDLPAKVSIATRRGDFSISLQPIASVTDASTAGFEAYAVFNDAEGEDIHLARLPQDAPMDRRAAFERRLFGLAAAASRRHLAAIGRNLAIHVPISDALLKDNAGFSSISGLIRAQPALAKSIVLSMPADLILTADPQCRTALDGIVAYGVALACEGWRGDAKGLHRLRLAGAMSLKLPVHRLLDRVLEDASQDLPGELLAKAADAAGLAVIATGIEHDEDAANLIDIGIDFMSGSRFAAPRRLREDANLADGMRAGAGS